MNTIRYTLLTVLTLISFHIFAQPGVSAGNLQFTIKKMSDNVTFGVFVKPDATIAPSKRTSTGSGQVTLVTSKDFTYDNLVSKGGTWVENARVNSPIEAPDNAYISFGFVTDEPKIKLQSNEETLLFTFVPADDYDGSISLIENNNDPFSTPNSYGTNPGNDLGMMDFGVAGGIQYYTYANNYFEGMDNGPAILASEKTEAAQPKAIFAAEKGTASLRSPK
ncbi:MAG: hypothetical protein H6577_23980 [Lewinellaceae bacterium]|nr:hypothetical protein [Saprospiraceae bacterium]MCB9341194.1 hypothetical protein [Lewinellaceae bacterium]